MYFLMLVKTGGVEAICDRIWSFCGHSRSGEPYTAFMETLSVPIVDFEYVWLAKPAHLTYESDQKNNVYPAIATVRIPLKFKPQIT